MWLKRATCSAVLGLLLIEPAMATHTWCAKVRSDVPGGSLPMRGGPAETEPEIGRLPQGEELELESAPCALRLSKERVILESTCREDSSDWSFVEYVPSSNVNESNVLEARRLGGGWVDGRYIEQHRCAWDEE